MKFEKQLEQIKKLFAKVGKRKLIITCAVLLIGTAVVLNWSFFSHTPKDNEGNTDALGEGTGEPASAGDSESYFAASLITRQRARDEAREVLQSVVDNTASDEASKKEALAGIAQMAKDMESEANIETLITSKGFAQCVAVISDGKVNIVVKSTGLTPAENAQINAIVYEQTGITPDNIHITEKN